MHMDEYVIIICMLGCGSEYNNCEVQGASTKCLISRGGGYKKIYNNVRESGGLRKMEDVRWKEQIKNGCSENRTNPIDVLVSKRQSSSRVRGDGCITEPKVFEWSTNEAVECR